MLQIFTVALVSSGLLTDVPMVWPDCIPSASGLGLGFIDAYLQSVISNFAQGSNFATAGATVQDVTYLSPFTLTYQVKQFVEFHDNVQSQLATNPGNKTTAPYIAPIVGPNLSLVWLSKTAQARRGVVVPLLTICLLSRVMGSIWNKFIESFPL